MKKWNLPVTGAKNNRVEMKKSLDILTKLNRRQRKK